MAAGVTYEPIATTTLTSSATDITFSSISASYTDLRVIINWVTATEAALPTVQFNGDTGANYSYTRLIGNGTSATSSRATGTAFIRAGTGTNGTNPQLIVIDVFSYAGSTFKTISSVHADDQNTFGEVATVIGMWRNTAAITSIKLYAGSGNLNSGSIATLYGITKA